MLPSSKKFAANPDVSFGDINLSKNQIRGNHNPGAGGWPTIRYFNKETGYEGKGYVKKTDKAMCKELGEESVMQAFVEEAGDTSLCSAKTGAGCSEKEATFLAKWQAKPAGPELARLQGLSATSMKPELAAWMEQRVAILKQLVAADEL